MSMGMGVGRVWSRVPGVRLDLEFWGKWSLGVSGGFLFDYSRGKVRFRNMNMKLYI